MVGFCGGLVGSHMQGFHCMGFCKCVVHIGRFRTTAGYSLQVFDFGGFED